MQMANPSAWRPERTLSPDLDDSAAVCKRKLQILEEKIQTSRQNIELLKTKTEHELLQIQNDLDTIHKEKVSKRSWSWLIVLILILLGIIALLVAGRKRFRMKIHRRLALQHEEKQKRIAEGELGHLASDLKDKGLIDIGGDLKDLSSEDAWVEFRQKFSGVYPQFFANLDKCSLDQLIKMYCPFPSPLKRAYTRVRGILGRVKRKVVG